MLGGNNKQHARTNARTPAHPSHTTHARRQWQTSGQLETERPGSTSGSRGAQLPRRSVLTAANVTLVDGDVAAVSITVNQRVLSPASLVGTHAATSDHFPHASPIRRNAFLLPAAAQTSRGPVRWSPGTLAPHWTYSLAATVAQFLAQRRDEVTA